jgi:hypothetical protein
LGFTQRGFLTRPKWRGLAQIADGLNRERPIFYRIPIKSVFHAFNSFEIRVVAFKHTQFLRVNINKPKSGLVET